MDIGANTGKFSIQCLQYNNEVKLRLVDLPQQLKVAKENISSLNLNDRTEIHAMNILDTDNQFPKGADIIWMSQFLDCFSINEITDILIRAKNAMTDNSSLYIMELLWDRQEYEASAFCLHNTSLYFTCFANGNSQMYQYSDLANCIEKAGLKINSVQDNIGISHTLIECKRA